MAPGVDGDEFPDEIESRWVVDFYGWNGRNVFRDSAVVQNRGKAYTGILKNHWA